MIHPLSPQVQVRGLNGLIRSDVILNMTTTCCIYTADILWSILSAPKVVPDLLANFIPYATVVAAFTGFVLWNGGIVLGMSVKSFAENNVHVFPGDKSNHVPAFHVPQLYYFVGFATIMGWPVLISGGGGVLVLSRGVWFRMFGNRRCVALLWRGRSLTDRTRKEYCLHLRGLPFDGFHHI